MGGYLASWFPVAAAVAAMLKRPLVFLLLGLCLAPAWAQPAPLFEAVAAGSLDEVERLLAAGAAVDARNAEGETPLYLAVEQGQAAIASALLGKRADVNMTTNNGETVLDLARRRGHNAIAELLRR